MCEANPDSDTAGGADGSGVMCYSTNSGSSAGHRSSRGTGKPGCKWEPTYGSKSSTIGVSGDKWPGVHRIGCESPDSPNGVDCAGGEDGDSVTSAKDGTCWSLWCLDLSSILVFFGGGAAVFTRNVSPDMVWLGEATLHFGAIPIRESPLGLWLCIL